MFINIHTHRPPSQDEWCIQNVHENFSSTNTLFHYSIGLHPWYISQDSFPHEFELVSIAIKKEEILAIGECGLDRVCETPFAFQKLVFIEHIKLANETAKPLIIHCVRAHREIIEILKENAINVPVIFHGFNNNETIAKSLLEEGYYLSLGAAIFNPSLQYTFAKIPIEKIFLETDDSPRSIQEIYQQAAVLKNISLEQLHLQIHKNYRQVFNANLL